MKANTVTDDKDLLAQAYTEIARLKVLLRQALKNNEHTLVLGGGGMSGSGKGSVKSKKPDRLEESIEIKDRKLDAKSELVYFGLNDGASRGNVRSRSGSVNVLTNSQISKSASLTDIAASAGTSRSHPSSSSSTTTATEMVDRKTILDNATALQIFEENEKLRNENKKMKQALEWSIKLAKKKRAETMEFDDVSADEILQHRQILNSIDCTALGNVSSSINLNKTIRKDSLEGKDLGENIKGSSMGRLKYASEVKKKSSVGSASTLLISPSSAGLSTGAGAGACTRMCSSVSTVGGSSPAIKKKERLKSVSLPQLFKSQKELDYFEYLTSSSRLGQQAVQMRCKSHQFFDISDPVAISLKCYLVVLCNSMRCCSAEFHV